jgi:hypothetical protein
MKSVQNPRVKYNKNPILQRKSIMSDTKVGGSHATALKHTEDPKPTGPFAGIPGDKVKAALDTLLGKSKDDAVTQGAADQAKNWAKPKV